MSSARQSSDRYYSFPFFIPPFHYCPFLSSSFHCSSLSYFRSSHYILLPGFSFRSCFQRLPFILSAILFSNFYPQFLLHFNPSRFEPTVIDHHLLLFIFWLNFLSPSSFFSIYTPLNFASFSSFSSFLFPFLLLSPLSSLYLLPPSFSFLNRLFNYSSISATSVNCTMTRRKISFTVKVAEYVG